METELAPWPRVFGYASLLSLNVRNTRSRHQDTLYASVSIKQGSNPPVTSPVIFLGDHNNGSIAVQGCVTPAIRLVTPVKVSISVYNWGHNPVPQKVADVAEAIVSAVADDIEPGAGEIIDAAYAVLSPLGFADCDGPVVLAVRLFDFSKPRPSLSGTDNGYNSPDGCGHTNSIYDYDGSLTLKPVKPPIPIPPHHR
jgi:hypothetical protein